MAGFEPTDIVGGVISYVTNGIISLIISKSNALLPVNSILYIAPSIR